MCSSGGGGASPSCDVNTLEADCDGDGANNEDELACGTDPKDPTSTSGKATDCDGDGVLNEVDIDKDNDGLIEIQTLAQLHAIRTDLDGDGRTDAGVPADPNLLGEIGCLDNACKGYELSQTLNFDENGDGEENDTYNKDDGTWEWNFFEGTDTFTCTFEDSINLVPAATWSFSNACNDSISIAHGVPAQESFSKCDGLFVGEAITNPDSKPVTDPALTGNYPADYYTSKVSIDRSKLPLSFFGNPSTPRINCEHNSTLIFSHNFPDFSNFPLFSNFSETCEDLTNQTGAKTNSLYSIKTASCDSDSETSTYKVNRFRGIFERNGFEIKWQ